MAKIRKGALYSMQFKEKGEEPMNSPNPNKWKGCLYSSPHLRIVCEDNGKWVGDFFTPYSSCSYPIGTKKMELFTKPHFSVFNRY